VTLDSMIDELSRTLERLEALHPLDAGWPALYAKAQQMHAGIEAEIKAEVRTALDELASACAGLEPEVRDKVISMMEAQHPELRHLIRSAVEQHSNGKQ
jgi:hypothetical protein